MEGTDLTSENFDARSEIEQLKIAQATQAAAQAGAQATQAATLAGAQATQAAVQAGIMATMAAGSVALIVGLFLGCLIGRRR